MPESRKTTEKPLGIFQPGVLFTATAVKQLCGWGEWAFRQNKKRGLRVLTVGKTAFVRSDDLIAFVEAQGQTA